MEKRLLSIYEAAEHLSVSPATVRRCIQSGKLVGQKVGGQWRLDPDELQRAFQEGLLSGGLQKAVRPSAGAGIAIPEWARVPLVHWGQMLGSYLDTEKPDHAVAKDRRGAKVWDLLKPKGYTWGDNLWHSTAIDLMTAGELQKLFAGKKVVLFDEMIQHGREMNRVRKRLEGVGASVTSFVCICRKSLLEAGELVEFKVLACEFVDEPEFGRRAMMISQLMMLPEPPLDVDHLVVKGRLDAKVTASQFLENLANWGLPFIVRLPEVDQNQRFLAVTLDRPQFFDTASVPRANRFRFSWEGPCKIRLYLDLLNRECFCVFIAYPRIEGHYDAWREVFADTQRRHDGGDQAELASTWSEGDITRLYDIQCMDLALSMLRDFITSGAAKGCGIALGRDDALDSGHLRATFGPGRGWDLEQRAKIILGQSGLGPDLFQKTICPPELFTPERSLATDLSHDTFACRRELLNKVPQKFRLGDRGDGGDTPLPYAEILGRLSQFSQATVGQVLDYELDWGTVKPVSVSRKVNTTGGGTTAVWRAFCRGEFDPWFETGDERLHGYDDTVMQKTLGIGPTVVENFLRRTGRKEIVPTHLAKLFANLRHDWRREHGELFYYLQPYTFGPIPLVEELPKSGRSLFFERFLVEQDCLMETTEWHGQQQLRRYCPTDGSRMPWRRLYEQNTDGTVKAHLGALVRFYAEVQKKCQTTRPTKKTSGMGIFHDPLVVLGAARNQKTAYLSGRFEFEDWGKKGEVLLARIRSIAEDEKHHDVAFLTGALRDFAKPAKLLSDKVGMYRNLPYLRQQLEALLDTGDFEIAHLVLETVDQTPCISSDGRFPVQNLDFAQKTMRAFSSLVRQIMTRCGLDRDDRLDSDKVDDEGRQKDDIWYLAELVRHAPELVAFQEQMTACTSAAAKGVLTQAIAKGLTDVFRAIVTMFDRDDRLPRPTSASAENRALYRKQEFASILLEIALTGPYGIAVLDVRPFMEMLRFRIARAGSEEKEVEGFREFQKEIAAQVKALAKDFPGVQFHGISGDSAVLASTDADQLLYLALAARTLRVEMLEDKFFDGCVNVGIAIHKEEMGLAFRGVFPGVIALKIGDRQKRKLGTIAVSQAFYEMLSAENRDRFVRADAESCEQGDVRLCEPG